MKLNDSNIIPDSPDLTVSKIARDNIEKNGGYLSARVLRRRVQQTGKVSTTNTTNTNKNPRREI